MGHGDNRRRDYRRVEDLYRKSIEEVKDYAIFMTDPGNLVVSWNLRAERILGYAEGEITGRSAALFFTPEDRASGEHERELATAAAEGRAEDERWHVRRDGTRFRASGVVTPVRGDDGRLLGFTKVMRDMTERRRIEEERDRFFKLSVDMLRIVRLDGYYRRVNPTFGHALGYEEEELLDAPVLDFVHPDDREASSRSSRSWRAASRPKTLRTASGAKTARTAGSVGATSPSPKRGWPTASVFGLLHLPNPWLTPATFCGGLLWAWDCQRAPNLWALAFSHSLMTVVLVTTVAYSALGGMRVGYGYFL